MTTPTFNFPASFAQQRLWFLDQFDPGQSVYNMVYAVRIDAPLDVAALQQSLNEVVKRHESLRTTLNTVDGEPMQIVASELQLQLRQVDLTGSDGGSPAAAAIKLVETDAAVPFDLARGPLIRAQLLKLGERDHVLSFVIHHLISDGWSMGVFLNELGIFYEGFVTGAPAALPELPIQYADYAVWQRDLLQGSALEKQLAYWKQQLANAPATLELAGDRTRPAVQTFKGARIYSELPATLVARLRALGREQGVTLFMTLLAAFDVLLWKFSGRSDVVVGTPIAGRNRPELEGVIGYFANTLPLRVSLAGNPTFNDLLKQIREVALGAYEYQELPFDKLVEELRPDRSLSHSPLFQVIFALENTPRSPGFPGLNSSWLNIDRGTSRADLSLFAEEKDDAVTCMWEYSTDLFDRETVRQMMSSYEALLESIGDNHDAQIAYLNIWRHAERDELLTKWNAERTGSGESHTIQHQFETQAELTPEATAVRCAERSLTFSQLNRRANQLAHRLRREGVAAEIPVGVFLERSVETIVALLGILKAGGAYVPIDPAYPAERVSFMLADSGVPVLITENKLLSSLPSLRANTICLDDWTDFDAEDESNPSSAATPENLAYIIYTSGSTGKPKGVEVAHHSVVHLFAATREKLGFRAGDVWTVVHSYAFDFSVWEIWGCLLQGGTLVVVPLDTLQSPPDLFELICRERVTILNQTPAALRELLNARARAGDGDWQVRLIVCGGDALDQELAEELARLEIPVWNFYGPTESTVWTTCAKVEQTSVCFSSENIQSQRAAHPGHRSSELTQPNAPSPSSTIESQTAEQTEVRSTTGAKVEQTSVCSTSENTQSPNIHSATAEQTEVRSTIGPPIRDLRVYILDQYLQPVPAGVPGELFIGGAGLARGYSRRAELTAEKFIPDPFNAGGARLYRTGDLARHRRDGRIEFIGRMDTQVKLRGFRVELGEIESALTDHPGVGQAVVIIREDHPHERRLVAYIVPRDTVSPAATDLRSHLRLTLPEYMVPSAFVPLAEIPLTPNQKVDRAALPEPEQTAAPASGYEPPRTPMEELLAGIWSQVLRISSVGSNDNFFELGGHSLLATQVTSRIRQVLNVELPVRAIFEDLTIAKIAKRLEEKSNQQSAISNQQSVISNQRSAIEGRLPLSFAQQRLWFLDQLEPGNPFYNIGRALSLRGALDRNALSAALHEIIRRHESLRTTFEADEGAPYQKIIEPAPAQLAVVDLSDLPREQIEAETNRLAAAEVKTAFDLTQGPLLRSKLIKIAPDDHVLILTMHHIAADEWSLAILFRELSTLYDAFTNSTASPLADLPIQYADYAAWQRAWLQGDTEEALVSYWRAQLAGAPTLLDLPTDKPRPVAAGFRGAYEEFEMPRALLDRIKALSRREGVTLFMTCLAAYQVLLSRFSGQQDLLVGTDVANRNRVETESLIGFFTNLLPLRARLANDLDFLAVLRQARETTLEAYAHQDLPFEKLVEALRPERDPGRNPMVQVLIVMQNPDMPVKLTGLQVSRFELPLESSRFDLVLFLFESERGLAGFWLYNPDLFAAESITRLSRNYERLLERVVEQPSARLGALVLQAASLQRRLEPETPADVTAPNKWHRQDADATLHRQDADATLHRRDVDAALHRQDVDATLHRQDADATLHRQDADATARRMDSKELQQSRLDRLRNIRRKGVDLAQVGSVKTGFLDSAETLPLVIEPGSAEIDLAEWAATNGQFIDENLLRHGALLFRGFAIDSVPEFEKFAATVCPNLFGEYGDLPREELGGKVYGSTPYPSDERILFHNESSHLHQWPMLIWFYCVQPARQGGESPIIDCRRIYQELDPAIRAKFERKGLLYVRNFTANLDVSWQEFFHTNERSVVEDYCRRASIDFEWKGDDGLQTRQVGPAVVKHPQTGESVFFNQLQLHHIHCLAPAVRESLLSMMAEEDLPRNVYYGDGSEIETAVMEHLGELYDRLGVSFPWARHDVLMLNNMLVAHSRNPYVGERKIVVTLGNLMSTGV